MTYINISFDVWHCAVINESNHFRYTVKQAQSERFQFQSNVQAKFTGINRKAWEKSMLAESDWSEWEPEETFTVETTALAKCKYSADTYNQKR